ncbi:MAG TPA: hypothetical protein ENJ09_11910 [Planctomycetes bacterium]|nr:hypothetical protein [Planctomycetota bacterium]
MGFLRLLALLAALLVLSDRSAAQGDELERAGIREVFIELPSGTTLEYFRIDAPPGVDGAPSPLPIGVARWISGPDPEVGFKWRTELEVSYFAEGTRVLQIERVGPEERELVFRELRDRSGRTVTLRMNKAGEAESSVAFGGDILRRSYEVGTGAALPLSIVEVARRGEPIHGPIPIFEPLSNGFEELTVAVSKEDGHRRLTLRRSGLLVGDYEFDEQGLAAFSWQRGGPRATRIDSEAFARMQRNARPLDAAATGNED